MAGVFHGAPCFSWIAQLSHWLMINDGKIINQKRNQWFNIYRKPWVFTQQQGIPAAFPVNRLTKDLRNKPGMAHYNGASSNKSNTCWYQFRIPSEGQVHRTVHVTLLLDQGLDVFQRLQKHHISWDTGRFRCSMWSTTTSKGKAPRPKAANPCLVCFSLSVCESTHP